jgi:kumamolisin
MATQSYVAFTPSHREAPVGRRGSSVPDDEPVEFSIYLKPLDPEARQSREEMATRRRRDYAAEIAQIRDFAAQNGLTVVEAEAARRRVRLRGSASAVRAAFKTELHQYQSADGATFRGRTGALSMPGDMAGIVEAVLGIDTRQAAQRRTIVRQAGQAGASYLPNAVGKFYGFPTGLTGAGQSIALIELGGGFLPADTKAAFSAMGLTPPSVIAVSVDGGKNAPTPDDGANAEVALDIQVAGGNAPGAKIAVYFAPNTDAGFVDAISQAAMDMTHKPSVMSISWGGPESTWSAQGLSAMTSALQDAASLGLSVFVAAGDNLATDGVSDGKAHVDFPASSPYAIGAGGTRITVADGAITAEVVWNEGTSGTGGGISAAYPVPVFQEGVRLPVNVSGGKAGRGVPDVAGNADPASGYVIHVNGAVEVVGGTSAVAPLWAGLTALINQSAGAPVGFFLEKLYPGHGAVREITSGNNKPRGSHIGYNAGPGWNACTGLGVPTGEALLALLAPPAV